MTLRTRIALLVIVVMWVFNGLIAGGIMFEVWRTNRSARDMKRLLLEAATERIYTTELLAFLRGITPDPENRGAGFMAMAGHIEPMIEARRGEADHVLESWALYQADGTWSSGDEEALPDEPAARQRALVTDGPVVSGDRVWRRLQFGTGAAAQTMGVIGLRFNFKFAPFDLWGQLKLILIVTVLGSLTVTLLLLWILGTRVFTPVDRLAEAAAAVSAGNYGYRVQLQQHVNELSHFTEVFNNMVAHVQGYSQDLEAKVAEATEQVRATEKRLAVASRLAATGRLAAEIAHEINNPVGGMINAARTLKTRVEAGKLDSQRAITYLELILDGLARVEHTVKEVLMFARREVRAAPLELGAPIERALNLVRHRAEAKGVGLSSSVPEELPKIYGDAGELQQVFLNLLINAVDATPSGGQIEIMARAEDPNVAIIVRDTGTGMTPEVREHVFDAFYTTKPEGEGTGIGLAIVHNIVTSHQGEISVASVPGAGSTFRITLPIHAG